MLGCLDENNLNFPDRFNKTISKNSQQIDFAWSIWFAKFYAYIRSQLFPPLSIWYNLKSYHDDVISVCTVTFPIVFISIFFHIFWNLSTIPAEELYGYFLYIRRHLVPDSKPLPINRVHENVMKEFEFQLNSIWIWKHQKPKKILLKIESVGHINIEK